MTGYEQTLLAAGIPPEQAARDAYANDMQMWRNREHPNYGVYDPDPPSDQEMRAAYELKYGDTSC